MMSRIQPHQSGRAEHRNNAQKTVDAGLDHHTAHHRRNVGRSRGVCLGQPDVGRDQTGLCAEADKRKQEDGVAESLVSAQISDRVDREEVQRRAVTRKHEHDEQEGGADVGRDQVDPAGAGYAGMLMVEEDQEERGKRHRLPADQEGESVRREDDQEH